jgi:MATE family multidrug resistance protein
VPTPSSPTSFRQEARALLALGMPIVLSQIAQVAMGLLDTVMSGRAGAFEQAVVGLGVALWIPVFIGLMSVVQAVSPVISHHFGAGDREAVARDAREGIWLALYAGLVPLLLVPLAQPLLVALRIDPALAQRTGVFLWGIVLGLPAALVYRSLAFYSASINQTRPVMVLAWIGLAVNAFLNWVLIYGHLGLPAMGGAGCGWATGIGMWVALAALAAWTARAPAYSPYYLWRNWRRPAWEAQKRLLKLGLPMGGAGVAEVAAFCSVAVLVGRFGDVQIAANQIALNFSALIFMFPMGISAAITVRVGHALGAGDARGARHSAWSGVGVGLVFATLAMLPIIALRHPAAALYSSDPAVQALAADLLLFAAFWQLFDATQVCAIGGLRGYKVTVLPMVLMICAFWGLGVPVGVWLGWYGALGSGPLKVYGFWTGLVLGLVTVSLGLAAGLRRVADAAVRAARQR